MNGSSGIIQENKFIGDSFKAEALIDNDGLTITNGPSVLATGINAEINKLQVFLGVAVQ